MLFVRFSVSDIRTIYKFKQYNKQRETKIYYTKVVFLFMRRCPQIFAIDDDPTFKIVLKAYMPGGYKIIFFNDPIRLAATVEQRRPDLVISDINIPEMSGDRLYQIVNEGENNPIPFLFVSGDPEEWRDMAGPSARQRFILKPLKKDHLHQEIQRALDGVNRDHQ